MIHNKRNQFRSEIRREELQGLFAFKRRQLLEGKITIFKDIQKEMEGQANIRQFQLVGKVIDCLHSYPEEQNSYILAGNILLNHTHLSHNLLPVLTETAYYMQNQMWCLKLLAFSLVQEGHQEDNNRSHLEQQMEAVMQTACQIFKNVLHTLKWVESSSIKDLQIWAQYMEITKIILNSRLYSSFPQHSVTLFKEGLSLNVLSSTDNSQELLGSWLCLKVVLNSLEQVDNLRQLLTLSRSLFWFVLEYVPSQRQECFDLLVQLLEKYSKDFMGSIFCDQLIEQSLYLMAQVSTLKPKVAHILKLLIPESSLDQQVILLNKGIHKMLTETMDWSMRVGCNPCLEDCLIGMYFLLIRFKEAQQDRLAARTLEQAQQRHFDEMLSGLSEHPQNETVQHFLDLLIDEFYTPEQVL